MRQPIEDPKSKNRNRSGFVFLATLGVLAVAIILVFAMAGVTRVSYDRTGRTAGELQERLMVQSTTDYALFLIARKKMAVDDEPTTFVIGYNSLTRSALIGTVAAAMAPADSPIYKPGGLAHRPGDLVLHIVSEQMAARYERYGLGEQYVLCNLEGRRLRPTDVTATLKPLKPKKAEKAAEAPEE